MTASATASEMLMPALTDDMESGVIATWLVADGATVAAGEEILEIETDKAGATVEATASGVLQIVVGVGETAKVGDVVAWIGGSPDGAAARESAPERGPALPPAPERGPLPPPSGEVRASPVARRVAQRHDVDLRNVPGTGPAGRIVRRDVELAAGLEVSGPPPPAEAASTGARGAVRVDQPTRLQTVVARRMADSKAAAPEFVLGVDVDMEEAVTLRGKLQELAGEDKPPSFNDFIVKAGALALREYPRANGAFVEGRFELYERINVGVAVAANDALVVPTIFDADRKSLGEIGRDSRRLAAAVRDGSVTPAELTGGTFTVSNLGMFGISEFVSILNPPQAAILSAGEMKRVPVEYEGAVALRQVLKLRLTCDHRILYGADAAGFLGRIKQLLQNPLGMSL